MRISPTVWLMPGVAILLATGAAWIAAPAKLAEASAQCPTTFTVSGASTVGPISLALKSPFQAAWPNVTVSLHPDDANVWEGDDQGIFQLRVGAVNVAQSLRELTPSEASGVYVYQVARNDDPSSAPPNPNPQDLLYVTRQNSDSLTGTLRIDDTPTVFGDDWINYAFSAAGQAAIAAAGYVPVTPGGLSSPAIPDWDVNMDGATGLSDLGAITAKWAQSSGCNGWERADENNNGTVSLGDIGGVIAHWGNQGFVPPTYSGVASGPPEQPCTVPPRGSFSDGGHAGWEATPGGVVYGTSAEIENYDTDPDTAQPYGFSTAWVMLTNYQAWAQVGWMKKADHNFQGQFTGFELVDFLQYTKADGSAPKRFGLHQAIDSSPTYEVLFQDGPEPTFSFFAGGQPLGEPVAAAFDPTVAQHMGEVQNINNQMPGNFAHPDVFLNEHYTDAQGKHPFAGQLRQDSRFGNVSNDAWQLGIWDQSCP